MEPAAGSPGDGELVARAQRGDLVAFGDLVRRYEATAVRVASVVCGSAAAEDAAQEGFIRAFRSLRRFEPGRPFRPWLLRIVVNTAKNRVRSEQRHLLLSLRAPCADVADDTGFEGVLAESRRAALAEALIRLPERDRLVLAIPVVRGDERARDRRRARRATRNGEVSACRARTARLREELAAVEVAP